MLLLLAMEKSGELAVSSQYLATDAILLYPSKKAQHIFPLECWHRCCLQCCNACRFQSFDYSSVLNGASCFNHWQQFSVWNVGNVPLTEILDDFVAECRRRWHFSHVFHELACSRCCETSSRWRRSPWTLARLYQEEIPHIHSHSMRLHDGNGIGCEECGKREQARGGDTTRHQQAPVECDAILIRRFSLFCLTTHCCTSTVARRESRASYEREARMEREKIRRWDENTKKCSFSLSLLALVEFREQHINSCFATWNCMSVSMRTEMLTTRTDQFACKSGERGGRKEFLDFIFIRQMRLLFDLKSIFSY